MQIHSLLMQQITVLFDKQTIITVNELNYLEEYKYLKYYS